MTRNSSSSSNGVKKGTHKGTKKVTNDTNGTIRTNGTIKSNDPMGTDHTDLTDKEILDHLYPDTQSNTPKQVSSRKGKQKQTLKIMVNKSSDEATNDSSNESNGSSSDSDVDNFTPVRNKRNDKKAKKLEIKTSKPSVQPLVIEGLSNEVRNNPIKMSKIIPLGNDDIHKIEILLRAEH